MSLDQFVACRRAPKLPDDLPEAKRWKAQDHKGEKFFIFETQHWLLSVNVEAEFPEERLERLTEDLADTGITGATPADYGVLVSVVLEPVTSNEDAIDAQMAVLDMLIETCDGIVLAN